MSVCSWERACCERALHPLWRQTRPGLIVHEAVCSKHVDDARARGYRDGDGPRIDPAWAPGTLIAPDERRPP